MLFIFSTKFDHILIVWNFPRDRSNKSEKIFPQKIKPLAIKKQDKYHSILKKWSVEKPITQYFKKNIYET